MSGAGDAPDLHRSCVQGASGPAGKQSVAAHLNRVLYPEQFNITVEIASGVMGRLWSLNAYAIMPGAIVKTAPDIVAAKR